MKKFTFLAFFVLSTILICLGVGTALGESNFMDSTSVQVNLTNQNPDAARPGEPVELTLSVQNIGSNNLNDISVKLNPKYPFSLTSGEALEQSISYLNARQDKNDAAVLKFRLMTDANTAEGTYDVDVITSAKESGSSSNTIATTKSIQLEVRGKEYAQIVTINKASIDLGKEEPLEFMITNTGNSPLKNMVVSWKDPKGVILPVYSDNTKYIKHLEPNKSVTVDYSVMADVNANPGLYTLDVNLNFENYESRNETIQTTAGLFVGGATDFDVSFSESSQGQTSFSVANIGNNMAYAVKASVPEQKGYVVMGSPSTIVGNLQKGDYSIVSFNLTGSATGGNLEPTGTEGANDTSQNSSSVSTNSKPLKFRIEYTDAKGQRIIVDKDVVIQTSEFMGNYIEGGSGVKNNNSVLPYLLILLIIVGTGIYMYRRRKLGAGLKKAGFKASGRDVNSGLLGHEK